jgi:hypothetical protein
MSVITADKTTYMDWPLRCATALLITVVCAVCMVAVEVYAEPRGSALNLHHEQVPVAW